MRIREVLLLLLLLTTAVTFRQEAAGLVAGKAPPEQSPTRVPGEWRYDAHSPYYTFVPPAVRQLESSRPHEVADAVCAALGGSVDFMETSRTDSVTLGFNCKFHEPELTITTDFGDLRRTSANTE